MNVIIATFIFSFFLPLTATDFSFTNETGLGMTLKVYQAGQEKEKRLLPGKSNTITIQFPGDNKNLDIVTIKVHGKALHYDRDIIYITQKPSKEEKEIPQEFENFGGERWTTTTKVRQEPELKGKTTFTIKKEEPKKGFFSHAPQGYFKLISLN